MNNQIAALDTKISGSDLETSTGGRIYIDSVPVGTSLPYIVVRIINSQPERTFSEDYTVMDIQFSIYSEAEGITEISGIYNYLNTLFDETSLTMTGSTVVWFKLMNTSTDIEENTTTSGTNIVRRWDVEYELRSSLN